MRLYIAAVLMLLMLMTAALIAGLTQEAVRGLCQAQVFLRARRRTSAGRAAAGSSPLPA